MFLRLSRFDHEQFNVVSLLFQAVEAGFSVGTGNVWITDHKDFFSWLCPESMEFIAHCSQDTVPYDDVVGVALEGDGDAVSVNRRRHGTRGAHLLSQQRIKRRA
jgi:hypothetical protein